MLLKSRADPFTAYRQKSPIGTTFSAGFPSYPANFSRDTIIAGIIAGRADMLTAQINVSAQHQGQQYDATTGEMPGKIHHEYPGAKLPDRANLTTYNACDTTSLFIIAVEGLIEYNPKLLRKAKLQWDERIKFALEYILDNIGPDNLFWESPPTGSDGYALRVTY